MRLIVSAGGTGGHIYPALAMIDALKMQDPATEILYVGSQRGLEKILYLIVGFRLKNLKFKGSDENCHLITLKQCCYL